tara:strand:+ start:588 stop:1304 length:717 start_codon:yes stop_codon:yes gene_type:complete
MIRLGVNIDHVATLRNARGETHPSPNFAAREAMRFGANSVTIHLREDRRHINDRDLFLISKNKKINLNLEIANTEEMIRIALKYKPKYVCVVPEKRKEITTEGGLNLSKNKNKLKNSIRKLNNNKIRTSLFINPNLSDIKLAKLIGANCVELHTGRISNKIKKGVKYKKEYKIINNSAKLAKKLNLEVHAGHGMDYKTAKILSNIIEIEEFNIGHFIIGESIFNGLKKTIYKFKKILK